MPNNPDIEVLLELHRIDSQIGKLTSQKELLPLALRRIETRLDQQRQTLEDKRERVKHLRVETHSREIALRSAEEEVQKLTVQLNKARTNKEYAAFQHEIAAKKADTSRMEDQVLAAMTDIDELQSQVRELEQSISQIEREHAEEAEGIQKETAEREGQIAELRKSRSSAAERVDPALLAEYERIAAKKGASALASVVAECCQGCHMRMPPQLGHVLRGGRQIVRCPNCSRLLYLP